MIFLSPQVFFFTVIYILFLFLISCINRFFIFWSIIELSTLIFMGLSYSSLKNSFSSLLIFFIIQSYSAFMLLIFYCLSLSYGFTLSIILKLSMFPFHFWYLSLIPSFRNFIFFLSSTFFKIPSVLIIYSFYYLLDLKLMFFSIVLTVIVGSISIILRNDFRFILVSSSVVNNSWFIMSQITSLFTFSIYFIIYSLIFYLIVYLFRTNSSFNTLAYSLDKSKIVFLFSIITIAGLPPFPLFYVKMFVIFSILYNAQSYLVLILIFMSVLTLVRYIKFVFNILMFNCSNYLLISTFV